MRLAALLVPEASGASTENGNTIGTITSDGSLFLVIGGLFIGLLAGTIWVIVSPWIPGAGLRRVLITVPIAIGLGTAGLVDGDNPDFFILRHDPRVIAALIALVGIIGAMFAVVDDWLEGRLPPATKERPGSRGLYGLISLLGAPARLPHRGARLRGIREPADKGDGSLLGQSASRRLRGGSVASVATMRDHRAGCSSGG